ncbi:hypothetical protein HELRODRAFT_188516 [Helobdella robusta]|uniref:T-box domain-containing protein n=1 Tax=Helobdella robusta TaxID=6412 RepID=T1FQ30_HELRO|nr:hypothetical protein HELRODRAFT_188516 [Helobdella robusta]ESO01901.1 hypothetical protein HELRODRAFT_188516 [Helobdella robusta]
MFDKKSAIHVALEDSDLWKEFSSVGTEMIVTKPGRRMYPPIRVNVKGLSQMMRYTISLEIIPCNDFRYKYNGGSWSVAGPSEDANEKSRRYTHEDSPARGSHWMSKVISFHKLKITNNVNDQHGHLLLHSMHVYQPRLLICPCDFSSTAIERNEIETETETTFTFPETKFMAVTAYQNDYVTRLKIMNNPFAKGVREKMLI